MQLADFAIRLSTQFSSILRNIGFRKKNTASPEPIMRQIKRKKPQHCCWGFLWDDG